MAKLKLTVHPLFIAFGIYFAFIGKVFSFIAFVLTAFVHEMGHYYVSSRYGYALNKVVLMPYGAVISGEEVAFKYCDEIKIAFAGPLINFLIAIFFVALWWIAPETYAYTDLVVLTNLTLASINLLPCYPLDGGRILVATLSLYFKRSTALKVAKIIGLSASAGLFALFVYSCFSVVNFSVLFFSLFMFFGVAFTSKHASYVRVFNEITDRSLSRGAEVKKIAISGESTLKDLLRLVGNKPCEVAVVTDGRVKKNLDFITVRKLFSQGLIYESIESNLKRINK